MTPYTCMVPLGGGTANSVRVSQFVDWRLGGGGKTGILDFVRAAPANYENLFYFCGGYVDPRSRRYYACNERVEAIFPLFTLDEVMPEDCPAAVEDLTATLAAFDAASATAFQPTLPETGVSSMITPHDLMDTLTAAVDKTQDKLALVHMLAAELDPYRHDEPVPVETIFNYQQFCESLDWARHGSQEQIAHWAMLEMTGLYDAKTVAKVIALFDFPLFAKAGRDVDHYDTQILAELYRLQRGGSLEEEAEEREMLAEEDGE